jgi:hypothetical protein
MEELSIEVVFVGFKNTISITLQDISVAITL